MIYISRIACFTIKLKKRKSKNNHHNSRSLRCLPERSLTMVSFTMIGCTQVHASTGLKWHFSTKITILKQHFTVKNKVYGEPWDLKLWLVHYLRISIKGCLNMMSEWTVDKIMKRNGHTYCMVWWNKAIQNKKSS